MNLRRILRLALAMLLVAVPSAYLLWQWAYLREPVLPGLSYASFNEKLTDAWEPPFWTYAIWVFLVFVVMSALTRVLDRLLGRVFPAERVVERS